MRVITVNTRGTERQPGSYARSEQASARELLCQATQDERHATLPRAVTNHCGRCACRAYKFSSASGHSTHCWAYRPVYRDKGSLVVKVSTFKMYEKFWAFARAFLNFMNKVHSTRIYRALHLSVWTRRNVPPTSVSSLLVITRFALEP